MEIEKTKGLFSMKSDYPLKPEEYPTLEEKNRSNSVSGLNDQRGKVLNPVAIGLGSTALAAAGTLAAMAATHVIDIDSFPNSFNPADGPRLVETKQVNPKEVFGNTAAKGVISERNIVRLSQEEIDRLYPDAFRNGILYLQYPIDLSNTLNPQAKISVTHSSYAVKFADGGVGNYHEFFFKTVDPDNSLDGAVIRSLVPNGNVILTGKSNSPSIDAGSFVDGFFTDVQDPNGNTHRLMLSGGLQAPSSSGLAYTNMPFIFESLINAPALTPTNNGVESKHISKRGEEIVVIQSQKKGNIIVHLGLIYAGQPSKGDLVMPPRVKFFAQDGNVVASE
jgi:hypothetical protein